MPYNANSLNNLQSFTGSNGPRRNNGRKPGSKNIKTITRELLEDSVDLSLPINEDMKLYLRNNGSYSYMKAVTLAMLVKAINGDTRAASLIFERSEKLGADEKESVFEKTQLYFRVVPTANLQPKNDNLE